MPDHHSVDAAIAWLDTAVQSLNREDVPLGAARERVLAKNIWAARPIPTSNRAARDGFAVDASASLGASSYNPVRLPLIAVAAGDDLPPGTDAVVPFELAEPDGQASIEVIEVVAAGDNVEQQGATAPTGAVLACAGTRLAARHIGLLKSAGVSAVPVVGQPHVRIVVAAPAKAGSWEDSNGSMICAAVERDGGIIGDCVVVERDRPAMTAALVEPGLDIACHRRDRARKRRLRSRCSHRGGQTCDPWLDASSRRNHWSRPHRRRGTGRPLAGHACVLSVGLRAIRGTGYSASGRAKC